jgi:hypothetical protein
LEYLDKIAVKFKFYDVTPREQLEVTARNTKFIAVKFVYEIILLGRGGIERQCKETRKWKDWRSAENKIT